MPSSVFNPSGHALTFGRWLGSLYDVESWRERVGGADREPPKQQKPLVRAGALFHDAVMNVASSTASNNWPDLIRPAMRDVATSGIVEVFNYGRGRQGLIPLWVGEGDLPTPPFISEAAKASLD